MTLLKVVPDEDAYEPVRLHRPEFSAHSVSLRPEQSSCHVPFLHGAHPSLPQPRNMDNTSALCLRGIFYQKNHQQKAQKCKNMAPSGPWKGRPQQRGLGEGVGQLKCHHSGTKVTVKMP